MKSSFGDSSAATLPAKASDDEGAALQVAAELLDTIQTTGLSPSAPAYSEASLRRWHSALTTLSRSVPLNEMIASALLERVNAAFADALRGFQDTLQLRAADGTRVRQQLPQSVVVAALDMLSTSYDHTFPLLRKWCAALGLPGVASFFSVHVRCVLLQADLISGEEPAQKRALFAFLQRHGHDMLNDDLRSGSSGAEEDDHRGTMDPVIRCLHRLTLTQSNEVKQLWRSVLEARIRERLRDLSDDFSAHFLHEQMAWLGRCVMPFVATVLDVEGGGGSAGPSPHVPGSGAHGVVVAGAAAGAEQEAWCADMRQLFLRSYARRRLASFWEILSDYPDSVPALEDMRYCLQANPEGDLKTELIETVRHLLSSRLHRAGTRTEDILAILINTIHAFCVLFPRNEQNSVVFAVIADTLDHLRKRKDCVTAIVQAVMQPNGAMTASAPLPPPPQLPTSSPTLKYDGEPSGDATDLLDGLHDGLGGGREEELFRTASRDRPDVLRVLLTSIHRRALVDEYQHVLAEQLLLKPMHEFDTTPEEEVLERLKQVFGETVLDKCAVMVRDMQMSRRITQQLREQIARRRGVAPRSGAEANGSGVRPSSVSVLSMTTWPPLARCSAATASDGAAGGAPFASAAPLAYRPHPALQGEMDALAEAYKRLKDNQRLAWLPSLGRVELELTQLDPSKGNAPVTVSQVLSLFDASVVLFVKELSGKDGVPLAQVAAALDVAVEELRPHVQALSPAVLVLRTDETVAMQQRVASSSDFVFVADKAAEEGDGKPAGLLPERVKLMERMIASLLKTRGPQAAASIHSSLKLLAKFEGTNADLLELLQSFIKRGLIVLNEAKLYALPPK